MVKEETKKFARENWEDLEQIARNGSTSASRIAEAIKNAMVNGNRKTLNLSGERANLLHSIPPFLQSNSDCQRKL